MKNAKLFLKNNNDFSKIKKDPLQDKLKTQTEKRKCIS